LARLFEKPTRLASKLIILFGQYGFRRVKSEVDLERCFVIVFRHRSAQNGLRQHFVEGELDVSVVDDIVIVLYDRHRGGDDVIVFNEVNHDYIVDVIYLIIVDLLDHFLEVFFTDDLLVETVGELLFIKNFVAIYFSCHKILFCNGGILRLF